MFAAELENLEDGVFRMWQLFSSAKRITWQIFDTPIVSKLLLQPLKESLNCRSEKAKEKSLKK